MSKYAQERMQSKREKKQKPDNTHYFEKQTKKKTRRKREEKEEKKKEHPGKLHPLQANQDTIFFFFFTCNAGYESAQTKT